MKEFIQIPNDLFEAISASGLSKNERKVVDLIIRCTFGCQREKALLIQRDFVVTGLKESHAREVIDRLINEQIIFRDKSNRLFWVNINLPKTVNYQQPRFSEILSKNLRKHRVETYRKSKDKLPRRVSEEVDISASLKQKTEPKEKKETLNTLKETGVYQKLFCFLSENIEDVRDPEKFLDAIIGKYGIDCLPLLINVDFHQWPRQLEYWKKVGKI
jgi:phage replication O-like protein O